MTAPTEKPRRPVSPDPPEVTARIRDGMELVAVIAKQIQHKVRLKMSIDELTSYGNEGLISAARSYDPTRGVPFPAWAALRVRGAMIDGVRASGSLPRRLYAQLRAIEASDATQEAIVEENAPRPPGTPEEADERLSACLASLATAMVLGFVASTARTEDETADTSANTPEALVADAELATAMRAAVSRLPDAERQLVERHYFDEVTLDEAARSIGLSKSWGSRLHARAIEMIARDLKRSRVGP